MTFDAGYSKNPLWKKLGCKPERPVHVLGGPDGFVAYLTDAGFDAMEVDDAQAVPVGAGHVHVFSMDAAELVTAMRVLGERIARDGQVWVSWPKKASRIAHDIDKNLLHEPDAFGDFVDVKVCAVDATWSGLKYVIRKDRR